MGLFGDKKTKNETNEVIKKNSESIVQIERPRICCIDLMDEAVADLEKIGLNTYKGTLGSKIKVPNTDIHAKHQLRLNYHFPENLHEYDIIIIDLDNSKTIDYKHDEHSKKTHTGKTSKSLLSSYPKTLFDPRPMSCAILGTRLQKIKNRKYLVMAFSSKSYEIEYEPVQISEGSAIRKQIEKLNIYSFWNNIPISEPLFGKEITIAKMRDDFQSLLEKYKSEAHYNQTFYQPTKLTSASVKDEQYFTLATNMNGDIVSFIEMNGNENLMILPQIKDKSNFIKEFLSKIAPSIYPELFPFSTTFNWKEQEVYWLPNHATLVDEKHKIQKEFENQLAESENKIKDNLSHYSFLHEIVTETGDNLVNSLIKFLKWLDFANVVDYDETNSKPNVLEEDIQVKLAEGLLILECKGIGGTSTDSDCSQISKIKYRRCKERQKFDVFALYVVNHQKYLPPLKRQNPPFTQNQIQDAINDERGLLITWQLFNLYFEIENGNLTKEEARNSLMQFGLVEFKPEGLSLVYAPTEILCEGRVCIVNIEDMALTIGDELFAEKNGKYEKVQIIDIQEKGKSIKNISNGEFGLKLNKKIGKKTTLWKKGSH
jgi:hypothetical protein